MLKLSIALVDGWGYRTYFWKGTTYGSFHQDFIRHNSEKGLPKDHSNKAWFQTAKLFQRKIFVKNDFLPYFLFLPIAAILIGGRGHRIQLITTQGPFLPGLVQTGPVVSKEKIKIWKFYDGRTDGRTTTDDGRPVVAIAHPAIAGELKI